MLAGAVLNVVVAWSGAMCYVDDKLRSERRTEATSWPIDVPSTWPPPRDRVDREIRSDHREQVWGENGKTGDDYHFYQCKRTLCGWPLASMTGWTCVEGHRPGEPGKQSRFDSWSRGMLKAPPWLLNLGSWLRGAKLARSSIPYIPWWPGFVVNTAFYTAILSSVVVVPRAIRRWRRISRNLCPACGYQLAGLSGVGKCPECGRESS